MSFYVLCYKSYILYILLNLSEYFLSYIRDRVYKMASQNLFLISYTYVLCVIQGLNEKDLYKEYFDIYDGILNFLEFSQ